MTKKKSIRVGHRGQVTKLISKINAELEKITEERGEIESLCESLKKKRDILLKLDSEILEEIDEEFVQAEIEEADRYDLDIERTLTKVRNKFSESKTQDTLPGTSKSTQNNTDLNPNAAEFPYTSSLRNMPNYELSHQTQNSTSHASSFHKLPKLNLPYFDGNLLNWQPFWDAFQSTIDTNPVLTDVQKLTYLQNQLQGIAAQCIAGLPLTSANYYQAVTILRERFGQTHKIVSAYIQSLIDLPIPKSNVDSLRNFSDRIECNIRGLQSLGTNDSTYGTVLTPIIYNKLPSDVRKNITRDRGNDDWDLQSLRDAIKKELCIEGAGQTPTQAGGDLEFVPTASFVAGTFNGKGKSRQFSTVSREKRKPCLFCNENHHPNTCKNVTDTEKRIDIVKQKKVGFNCFGSHRVAECKSEFKCKQCGKKHHTSICNAGSKTEKHQSKTVAHANVEMEEKPHEPTALLHSTGNARSEVMLKTAVAPVWHKHACFMTNILMDEGAQNSFITEELACNLGIKPTSEIAMKIAGFGGQVGEVRYLNKANIEIETTEDKRILMEVVIVPKIAAPIQMKSRKEIASLPYLKGLHLAHPISAEERFNVSLLVGADYYWSIVEDSVIRGNGPTAVKSKLGYLISGPMPTDKTRKASFPSSTMMNILVDQHPVRCDLEKFWTLESLGVTESDNVKSQMEIVQDYGNKGIKFDDGQYTAELPWKQEFNTLPTNLELVEQRTENVIRRLERIPELLKMYGKIISDQEKRGFIERVEESEFPTNRPVHYIPHHPVAKDSSTTPIRIVYDCSCKDGTGTPSLNECLESHPPVMNDLTGILMRFRANKFATTADLEKAFLHVKLAEKDRDVTRFLWLSDPTDTSSPLATYRFKSVLFGATCSPFILSATLLKHFKEHPGPISETLENGLYVDNILTSFTDENTAVEYYREARKLLRKGGFNLRSWNSNSTKLRQLAEKEKALDTDEQTKILGLKWNITSDELMFQQTRDDIPQGKSTKRQILKSTSSIFDPLGLLSPVTVKAKIFMQSLWKQNLDWDQLLPVDIETKWREISQDLSNALNTKFRRSLDITGRGHVTLHVFTDASIHAYGACAYIKSEGKPKLVMAKNRVAPTKEITLPKLELMGAVIGARLAKHIHDNLAEIDKTVFWCDSQIVLSWLHSTKQKKVFIQNRITEIKELCENSEWKYCPTVDNPADLLTRGISCEEFTRSTLWINGPTWLGNETHWPKWDRNVTTSAYSAVIEDGFENEATTIMECNVKINLDPTNNVRNVVDIERFSSYRKLNRITAYVLRFIRNCRKHKSQREIGVLNADELYKATQIWIRDTQSVSFRDEIDCLKRNTKPTTLVRQLKLSLDDNKIVRCSGRLEYANVSDTVKHPFLLPAKDRLTYLVILDAHERTQHSGIKSTVTYVQQTFWIPKLRHTVKLILSRCVLCRKVIGKPYSAPDTPPLPKERVQESTPFSITGVDFTGALTVRDKHNTDSKAYVCLFTCAVTRAVHLELVPNLTEKSFIQCFRRFVSRRSLPSIMLSDNALTFKHASNEISRICNSNQVKEEIQQYGIQWRFIPSRAPWFGGWWERLIGLTKTSLKKVLQRSLVDEETLRTILTEIEATLNDRPITYVSTDIRDPEPLTPSHLIFGRRITSLPYMRDTSCDLDTLDDHSHTTLNKQVSRQQELLQNLQRRWKDEYLVSLRDYQQRKGLDIRKINIGDVVQIHDEGKRVTWRIGVVSDVITGKDGLTRVAMARTPTGIVNRPVTKLYPLKVSNREYTLRRSDRVQDRDF